MPKYSMKYFTESEVGCKCGCGGTPRNDLKIILDNLRKILGKPIRLTNCFRCEKHNKAVGGHPNSFHMQGMAADIAIPDNQYRLDLIRAIGQIPAINGVLFYKRRNFIHIDIRDSAIRCCKEME